MSNSTKPIDQLHQPSAGLSTVGNWLPELLASAARAWDLSQPKMLAILLLPFLICVHRFPSL